MGSNKWLKIVLKPGNYERSAETIEQILEAALKVLVNDGYAALTFRRVEQESGLKVGHISYHFPTKEDLVRGLLDAVMAGYSDRSDRLVTATEGGDRAQFRAAIVTILRDIQTFETTHLFPELCSMANPDPAVIVPGTPANAVGAWEFDKEEATSYEVGMKSSVGGVAELNSAAFCT